LKGKRIAMLFGLFFLGHLIKFYRKSPSHKACYVPLRQGLMTMDLDPYNMTLNKSEGYGPYS